MKAATLAFAFFCALPLIQGCMDQTARSANDMAIERYDDGECRAIGEQGTTAYNRCRAQKAAVRDRMAPQPTF